MSYFKGRHSSRLALDHIYPTIDYKKFKDNYWTAFCGDVKEAIPPNYPTPLGNSVDPFMMVDSNHAGNKLTRRSCTGILISCNMALINWLPKKQPTV